MNNLRNNNIGDLIRQLASNPNDFIKSLICVVREYDSDYQTVNCEPINTDNFDLDNPNPDNYLNDVRLTAFKIGDVDLVGQISIPKINSYVIVSFIDGNDKFISMYSQIDKFQYITEVGTEMIYGPNPSDDDEAYGYIKSDNHTLMADQNIIRDINNDNFIIIDNSADTSIQIISKGHMTLYSKDEFFASGDNLAELYSSNGKVIMSSDGDNAEIYGSKIKIYNDITTLKTILSDLITTLNTNVVPDCTLVAPYGAATGTVLASDLIQITNKINSLLA